MVDRLGYDENNLFIYLKINRKRHRNNMLFLGVVIFS